MYFFNRKITFKEIIQNFGLKKIHYKDFFKHTIIILLYLFLISFLINLIFLFFGYSDLNLVTEKLKQISPIIIIYLLVVRVFLEEWFFRGFLVSKVGIWASSLLFGIAHYGYGSIVEVVGAFILGLFLAYYFKKIKNLWPLYTAHLLYNFFVISLIFLT